jgi:F-type H+-transporting ATPase subunit epsilon
MGIELIIVTPQGESFRGTVDTVILPGSEGEFGVLPDHERYLTPLRVGAAEIRTGNDTLWAAIADGFADVQGDLVTVLVESCDLAHDIDTAEAERAHDRAVQGLAALDPDADRARYEAFEASIERARVRLEVGRKS